MEYPDLREISWDVDEPTYRKDKALSYSTLARFAREGFNKLEHLYDDLETPSLTFGSAVDAIITGGLQEFNRNFLVADFPDISDNLQMIARKVFEIYSNDYRSISSIEDSELARIGAECDFYANDKYKNYRVKLIKENCQEYYNILYAAQGKKVLSTETGNQVMAAVHALKESPQTRYYFETNNPFDKRVQRFYQLKFKATFDGIEYRCMADEIIVDHEHKLIYPVDLKTSSSPEWDFYKSFIKWRYDIQGRLYWRIIEDNLKRHPVFKDYKLQDYIFIVINKETLTPLVWTFPQPMAYGTLKFGVHGQIELEDPFKLGQDLHYYLTHNAKVPIGILTTPAGNDISKWLNKLNY